MCIRDRTILEHYPKPSADMLMNFLSTHDTERILTRLAGEDVGWQDVYKRQDLKGAENAKATAVTAEKHIVIVEDSQFLNKMIVNSLSDIGFKEIRSFPNGKEAWDYISQFSGYNGDVTNCVAAVITDIEMPQMDGHHLTKLIKSDPTLKKIPVFLFSSLINEQMYQKGLSVGADEQFSKPQIGMLIERLIQDVYKRQYGNM